MAGEAGEERWLPIEANPEVRHALHLRFIIDVQVMNCFLGKLGVPPDWQIHDVLGLEPELLALLPRPVLGLMLLGPVTEEARQEKAAPGIVAKEPEKLYYMKQTVSNACGTVALLHCVANARSTGRLALLPDSPLERFLSATAGLTPEQRAHRLETDEAIVRVHDAAAREGQTAAPLLEDRVDHHFVALVEVEGRLWQLDGRREGPVMGAACEHQEDFLSRAAAVCKEHMARDPTNLRFNVLALAASSED
jgi:ubiquitin carboxyl-terminal hydrolase L3